MVPPPEIYLHNVTIFSFIYLVYIFLLLLQQRKQKKITLLNGVRQKKKIVCKVNKILQFVNFSKSPIIFRFLNF